MEVPDKLEALKARVKVTVDQLTNDLKHVVMELALAHEEIYREKESRKSLIMMQNRYREEIQELKEKNESLTLELSRLTRVQDKSVVVDRVKFLESENISLKAKLQLMEDKVAFYAVQENKRNQQMNQLITEYRIEEERVGNKLKVLKKIL